ncbi:hypothetical protein E2C01_062353 [Portunus trituberculatus]|uniref:Uncharacterized protein n=1 Tax=Portunus trituberculatus TaxID=210409 RepID=A0A5B7HDT6_PORTR|nr:hypothetical protein [Portunus trituberculatus]
MDKERRREENPADEAAVDLYLSLLGLLRSFRTAVALYWRITAFPKQRLGSHSLATLALLCRLPRKRQVGEAARESVCCE